MTSEHIFSIRKLKESLQIEFPDITDEIKSHKYFCSYDFHENESYMLDYWKEVIDFIFKFNNESITKLSFLTELLIFNGRKPLGLINVIKDLLNKSIYITTTYEDLKKYNEELINNDKERITNKQSEGWLSILKTTISSYIWNSKYDQLSELSEDMFLINKSIFYTHSKEINSKIEELCNENDINSFQLKELINILNKENKLTISQLTINFLISFLEIQQKVLKFECEIGMKSSVCLRRLVGNEDYFDKNGYIKSNDYVKDCALMNISYFINELEMKIHEFDKKCVDLTEKIKDFLKVGNRIVSIIFIFNLFY